MSKQTNNYGSSTEVKKGMDPEKIHGKLTRPVSSLKPGPAPQGTEKKSSGNHIEGVSPRNKEPLGTGYRRKT